MPASRIAPRVTAWRTANRGLPGVPAGGFAPGGVPFLDQFVPGYRFGVRIYPGADTTTDPTTWTPVDISAHILQPGDGSQPAITIQRGRLGEQQETAPARCSFTLRNDAARGNGNYSPRRATSVYYPYMRAGLPVDVFINNGVSTFIRFAGKVEELAPGFDETGNYAVVIVTAYGVWQNLSTSATPLRSPMYRTISAAPTNQVAYWSLEDGVGATSASSEVAGVRPMRVSGSVSFGQPGIGGTASYVDFNDGGMLSGVLTGGTATNHWGVLVGFEIQDTTSAKSAYPVFWSTSSAVYGAVLYSYDSSVAQTGLAVWIVPPAGSGGGGDYVLGNFNWQPGTFHTLLVYSYAAGAGLFNIGMVIDGWDIGTEFIGLNDMTGNPGALRRIDVNPQGTDFGLLGLLYDPSVVSNTLGVAHVAAWQPFTPGTPVASFAGVNPSYDMASGFSGETPSARLTRVCAEEDIPSSLPAGSSDPARTMGAQPVDTLYNVLRECETAEGGVLEDGINFGLALWTVESRYNQIAAITPALTQLAPPLLPVENTMRVRNDVTASLPSGSSGRYQQPSGQPYAVSGPGGIGGRSFPVIMNIDDPDLLVNRAAWLVHLGTIDADRYSPLAVNLAARTSLIMPWLYLTNGQRWTTPTTYSTGGLGPDVLVEGWTEGLGRMCYTIAANTSPADPWNVAVVDDPTYAVVDSDTTTLVAVLAAGVTGAVSVNVGTLWSTAAGDYPLDMRIDGERVTVSAVAGAASPQTFTISARAVNGVSKDHNAGASVSLWLPVVVGV